MKTLQNNFTTPKQSKRLLKLGVPRWSADEYRDEKGHRHSLDEILDVELFFQNFPDYLPCWSVGRLIEIYYLCTNRIPLIENEDCMYYLMEDYELGILSKQLDFSKLKF